MTRTNFRVKVDLSKFYHDARRSCWVFVDSTKISQISHIKQHITKLFNICEPYHLCLNDTDYLPPAEDVRIVKENETLVVIPGSGLGDEVQSTANFSSQHVQSNGYSNNKGGKTFTHKEAQTIEFLTTKPVSTKDSNTQSSGFLSDSKQGTFMDEVNSIEFHSIINDIEGDSDIDFKTMGSNITEDSSATQSEVTNTKPKRIRHRKGKKKASSFIENSTSESSTTKKPKIIDSLVISSGKHIRFSLENNNAEPSNYIINDISTSDQCTIKSPQCKELSTLLALRNSSTPLTFANKKMKEEIGKLEDTSNIEERDMDTSCEKTNETLNNIVEKNVSDKDISQKFKNQTFSDAEFQTYPPVKSDAQSNDIIAFKMLNFGKDYSPQVSKVIVAQVISFFPPSEGLDEVHFGKIPSGKFSISEEEKETVITDIFNINYAQMIEPRFVKRFIC
ncbi:hypothetical protein KPH14_010817 [Odynerus spinipes]|uniref:Coilin N-terminal domain-containing protein n=1 Tax=Odynerus spinipes TaxID=1348599 RepID=A0AAD9VMU1_9HYME|nr:hypothetical protein KPH14_010817 [Odynerus spinipes]